LIIHHCQNYDKEMYDNKNVWIDKFWVTAAPTAAAATTATAIIVNQFQTT
jgi:hypothetical protein